MLEMLAKSPIFKGLSTYEIDECLKQIHYQVRSFSKEDIIALSGDKCERLLVVIEGSVRGEMVDYSGKTIKIEDIESPDTVAEAFLFGDNNTLPVDIISNTETSLLVIQKDSLIRLFQINPDILKNYLNILSNRFQTVSKKLRLLSFKTIKGKIAHYILLRAKGKTENITLGKTQNQLAEYFGVTRPAYARAVSEMQKDNIIVIDKKNISIKNQEALKQLME